MSKILEKSKLALLLIPLIFLFANLSSAQVNENSNNGNNDTITLRTLHNELDTAGEWIKIDKSELDPESVDPTDTVYVDEDVDVEYVWRPHYSVADDDWNPYNNGQWVWCDVGWTWVSDYTWGWLPYHYGRWWCSPVWGWVWSPGYTWAPCWVSWYWYGGYYGWYPISP